MSRAFTCPKCGQPHKEIVVPSESFGVFVSNKVAERIALDPSRFFDDFGWREDVGCHDEAPAMDAIVEAIKCECGWIGPWPPL